MSSAYAHSSGDRTHGAGRTSDAHRPPQSSAYDDGQEQLEYDGLVSMTRPPRKNCCTWKVATVSLVLVAVALIVTWQAIPAEEIAAKYIPQFDEPANPYTGPEAGSPSSSGGATGDTSGGAVAGSDVNSDMDTPTGGSDNSNKAGTVVPSFMKCPEDGGPCCNGSTENCKLRVDQMMFGLVHNAMSSEGKLMSTWRCSAIVL